MQTMFKEITTDQKQPISNPFANLRLKETKTKGRRKAIPPEMIQRILTPGAMGKLNVEARDVMLICLNTGCRPSEVCGVLPEHIHLKDDTSHFDLVEEGRELKSGASIRKVVLLGVAPEAIIPIESRPIMH